ncbi:LysE family translocator [Cochlodiniinecator piscidefendens]|uniref:LysE family translocator n=1 Tax=Cochlodiniinecator piscidefendens TaxID=2715756 RepID=UPI00140C7C83|nr:LysE family translocator [Cochlodiniinecator piscidefendens]
MNPDLNLSLILLAGLIASASPGPATMAIAGTSMGAGRGYGLAVAAGVTSGSFIWSIAAAFGLAAVMVTNAWAFEVIRYFGAAYLLFLAYKSAKSAIRGGGVAANAFETKSHRKAYLKGLALHLTNPKAVLFFGSLYAIGLPAGAGPQTLLLVIFAVGLQSAVVFHGYALLFSSPPMMRGYVRLKRWFEAAFAAAFGVAGLKILTTRIE